MSNSSPDQLALAFRLRAKLRDEGVSLRQAEKLAGVSASTLSRFLAGNPVGVEAFARILWYASGQTIETYGGYTVFGVQSREGVEVKAPAFQPSVPERLALMLYQDDTVPVVQKEALVESFRILYDAMQRYGEPRHHDTPQV